MTMEFQDTASVRAARKTYDESLTSGLDQRRVTWFPMALLVALLLFPAMQFVGNYNYEVHLFLYTASYVAMAAGWNILGGFTGYISLGHNVFFAIGGYFAGMLLARYGISTIAMAPVAGLLCGVIGYVIGLITLRVRGPAFIISSLAMVMIVRILFEHWQFVGGANGVALKPLDLPPEWVKLPYYYAFIVLAAFAVWLSYRIKHSKFGLGLRAISKDEIKAESAGIDTRRYKIMAFAISGAIVGMTGAVWGEYLTYIRPNIFLVILISVNMVLMCIIGGKGTVAGPVIGAILIVAFNEFFVATLGASELNILATGLIMMLALMFFPLGIVGTLARHKKLPRFLNWD